jgi:hypothetical protein
MAKILAKIGFGSSPADFCQEFLPTYTVRVYVDFRSLAKMPALCTLGTFLPIDQRNDM